jgi:hypothetical protein
MLGAEIGGTGGWMEAFGIFADDPACQKVYRSPEKPVETPRLPIVKNPVPILFWPVDVIAKEDGKEHEGVSFAQIWADDVARTIWLGVKPFMLTSQYFRGACLGEADDIRKHPDRLLREFFYVHISDFTLSGSPSSEFCAQLVPHLIWALERQGRWPYFHLPGAEELRWQRVYKDKAA